MKTFIILPFFIILFIGIQVKAQDVAFSQFDQNPFATNPSELSNSNLTQVQINYRFQNIGEDYTAPIMVTASHPFLSADGQQPWGALGLSFINQRRVDGSRTEAVRLDGTMVGFAYRINNAQSFLSFGLQGGAFWQNIEEYYSYDTLKTYIGMLGTVGAGVQWTLLDEDKKPKAFLGLSALNMNQPSFTNKRIGIFPYPFIDPYPSLPLIINITGGFRINFPDVKRASLIPTFRWIQRESKHFYKLGAWLKYDFPHAFWDNNFQVGAWYTSQQATILATRISYQRFYFTFSYDLGLNLKNLSDNWFGQESAEFSLGMHFGKKQ